MQVIVTIYFVIGAIFSLIALVTLIIEVINEIINGNKRVNPPIGAPQSCWDNVAMAPIILPMIIIFWPVAIKFIIDDRKQN